MCRWLYVAMFFLCLSRFSRERRVTLRRGQNGFGFNIVGGDGEEGNRHSNSYRLSVDREKHLVQVFST
jgi:hypothetical protein